MHWLFDNEYNRILDAGEKYEYDWRFNLSKGATAKLVTNNDLINKLTKIALNATKMIGARFVSVDIVSSNNNLYLMEINSGVCIDLVCNFIDKDYQIAKSIYREAILKMFE